MRSNWLRTGNFHEDDKTYNSHGNPYHHAVYINTAEVAIITRVSIRFTEKSPITYTNLSTGSSNSIISTTMYVQLDYSPYFSEQLLSLSKSNRVIVKLNNHSHLECYDWYNYSHNAVEYGYSLSIDAAQFKWQDSFFNQINASFAVDAFGEDFKFDFSNIVRACANDSWQPHIQQRIPLHQQPLLPASDVSLNEEAYLSDEKENVAKELIYGKGNTYQNVLRLLLKGHDPNLPISRFSDAFTPIRLLLYRHAQSLDLLKLLLWYGLNPFKRPKTRGMNELSLSGVELAKGLKNYKALELIISSLSTPQHYYQPSVQAVIRKCTITKQGRAIITNFFFVDNNIVTTVFKRFEDLRKEEIDALFKSFEANFNASHDREKIKAIFADEFTPGCYIDIIHVNGKVVGFSLYELLKLVIFDKHLILHCIYSGIDKNYRGLGLMLPLIFRPGYALRLLIKDKLIGVFFSAVDYNSYRLLRFLHYPKHQPAYMNELIKEILSIIYKGKDNHQHDLLMSYITENIRANQVSTTRRKPDLNEHFYHTGILGKSGEAAQADNEMNRSAPALFMVGADNHQYVFDAADALGFNLDQHVSVFAEKLSDLLPLELSPSRTVLSIRRLSVPAGLLFWQPQLAFPELAKDSMQPKGRL